ncbi:hydrogenase 4 membrane subunit [Sulfurospirillum sp. 1612]|uniref:hydrogenase 4 membrane subunit n=1 Tax=Sulfurospirillum sp. 1612 TaxID=3094835 RepID=UPI002F94628B
MDVISILSILMMVTSLLVFSLRKYKLSVYTYIIQTMLLVSVFYYLGVIHHAEELFGWAIIATVTKVIFVPFVLFRLIQKLKLVYEDEPTQGFFVSPIIAMGFSLAIAMSIYPIFMEFSLIKESIPLIASIVLFMMGVFGFILRNSAFKQILAYCMFENGIHLSLAVMAYNSPEIAELGILTDAIFAVLIMATLAERFYKYFGSLDVSKATELKG